MSMNYGASWGGNDEESIYGGTSYGSGWGGRSSGESPQKNQEPQKSALPVVALIAAILGLLLSVIPIVGLIFTSIALVLSVAAGYRAFKKGVGNKGLATAAIIVTFIGDSLAIIATVLAFFAFNMLNDEAKKEGMDLTQLGKTVFLALRQEPDAPPSEELQENIAAMTKTILDRQASAAPAKPSDKGSHRPNGPTVEDFLAIKSDSDSNSDSNLNSESNSADEGGLGGEEAVHEAANANAENINESQNQNEDETDGEEAPQKLTKEAVKDVFRQNVGNFRSCYQKALEQNPDVSGKMLFKFTVNQEGHVQDVAALETGPSLRDAQMELHNPEMEDCLRENFKNMNFPKFQTSSPDGNFSVVYPMVFRTDEE